MAIQPIHSPPETGHHLPQHIQHRDRTEGEGRCHPVGHGRDPGRQHVRCRVPQLPQLGQQYGVGIVQLRHRPYSPDCRVSTNTQALDFALQGHMERREASCVASILILPHHLLLPFFPSTRQARGGPHLLSSTRWHHQTPSSVPVRPSRPRCAALQPPLERHHGRRRYVQCADRGATVRYRPNTPLIHHEPRIH